MTIKEVIMVALTKKEVFDEDSLTSDDMLEKYNNMLHDFVSEKSQYNKVKSQYDIKR